MEVVQIFLMMAIFISGITDLASLTVLANTFGKIKQLMKDHSKRGCDMGLANGGSLFR